MKKRISRQKYYKNLDLLRILSCIAILLYHLNILKGGYLAVCTFFVLTSYLSCLSEFKKDKFSIKDYYLKRIVKLYIPLIIVVFSSLAVISLFPNISWFNLKPETTSVLLGYNNFWQLNANLDYFARHINSPFIHLWYIAILLQFDLVFPLIFVPLRKLGDKVSKSIPCIITALATAISTIYFYRMSLTQNMMVTYYDTFTRLFSLLFGLTLAFFHNYYKSLLPNKFKESPYKNIIFTFYLILLSILFVLIDSKSPYFASSMVITTILTCRIIDYATTTSTNSLNLVEKVVKSLSDISYEIYLTQYPIIFLFQYIKLQSLYKLAAIILVTIITSYIIHFALKKTKRFKVFKYLLLTSVLIVSIYGAYQYYLAKDHTLEMKKLKEQLAQNEQMIKESKEKYATQLKQEQEDWTKQLENLEECESKLNEVVSNLPIVGVGDSVMLGAISNLQSQFPNGYFDAKVSRTAWKVAPILKDLTEKNMLGNPIVLNLGANGDCSKSCKAEIMQIADKRQVFWLNTTNNETANNNLYNISKEYSNLHLIDWSSISSGHSEYFYADGIHLTPTGRVAYTKAIYDAIYQEYLNEYNEKKKAIISEHEEQEKNKISFYGNTLLLNSFEYIEKDFTTAAFIINKDYTYKSLKSEIEQALKNNAITNKIVLAFDNTTNIKTTEYEELLKLCKDKELYIVATNTTVTNLSKKNYPNLVVLDFTKELKKHPEYFMADGKHLSDKGNKALSKLLKENIKQNDVSN